MACDVIIDTLIEVNFPRFSIKYTVLHIFYWYKNNKRLISVGLDYKKYSIALYLNRVSVK